MKKGTALFVGLGTAVVGLGGAALVATRGRKQAAGASPAAPPQATPTSAVLSSYPVPPVPLMPGASGTAGAPTVPQVVIPQMPSPDYQEKVSQAIASGNPQQMRAVAAELRKAGNTTAAQALEQYASAAEVTQASISTAVQAVQQVLSPQPAQPRPPAPAPAPQPAPPIVAQPLPGPLPQPAQPQPPPSAPVMTPAVMTVPVIPGITSAPIEVPMPVQFPIPPQAQPAVEAVLTGVPSWPETDGSRIAVAQKMATNLAGKRAWAEDQSLVKKFQTQQGLKADGLYGPGTATVLGQQYGIIPPKPLYWSKTTSLVPQQKADYRAAMTALSVKDPVRAAQWIAAGAV